MSFATPPLNVIGFKISVSKNWSQLGEDFERMWGMPAPGPIGYNRGKASATKKSYAWDSHGRCKVIPNKKHWSQELSTAKKRRPSPNMEDIDRREAQLMAEAEASRIDHDAPGSVSWLEEQFGSDIFCGWCANSLTLEYNQARSGWQIQCPYCGAKGPCEGDPQAAADGYISFTRMT